MRTKPAAVPTAGGPSVARLVLRLCRANMTVITAVTHLAAAIVSTSPPTAPPFSVARYLRAWLFILLTQFTTHFLGELHDLASDRLNRHATPLTGGSRVLSRGLAPTALARRLALAALAGSLATLAALVPRPARPLGLAMVALAVAYTTPPPRLNYRALGELDAALVTSVLVPLFSALAQGVPARPPRLLLTRPMLLLIVPPFLAKIALFLALNLADRRPDWATGKVTLAVRLGDAASARLHAALLAAAYAAAAALALLPRAGALAWHAPSPRSAAVLLFLLPAARVAARLSLALLRAVPYRLDALLPAVLTHSTYMVWGIALHASLVATPVVKPFTWQNLFLCIFAWLTLRLMRKPRRERGMKPVTEDDSGGATLPTTVVADAAKSAAHYNKTPTSATVGATLPASTSLPYQQQQQQQQGPQVHPDTTIDMSQQSVSTHAASPERYDAVIVGGGVAGLVAAISLHALGRSVIVLERRAHAQSTDGADLALWPGAIKILRRLGVPSQFFTDETFPLHTVKMCNMQFSSDGDGDNSGDGNEAEAVPLDSPPSAQVLKTIDMDAATDGTGEHFVLVSRESLMSALRALVPDGVVVYGARVVDVVESEDDDAVTLTYQVSPSDAVSSDSAPPDAAGSTLEEHSVRARVAIGADGSRSLLREHVNPKLGAQSAVRFCGEVCYRGVLALDPQSAEGQRLGKLLPDAAGDGTMRINYGAGLRSSFGYLRADGAAAYWWVKQVVPEMPASRDKLAPCPWPEPLRSLHDLTPRDAFYVHPIEDSASLPRWASPRVALVGDAAHVVSPNMGQGACLAAEDAFVLAAELANHWKWPDGHIEAFYQYQMCRKPFAEAVASEARKQLFLGQLQSPLAVWLRETLLSWLPASVLIKKLRQNNFDVKSYIELFDELTSVALKT